MMFNVCFGNQLVTVGKPRPLSLASELLGQNFFLKPFNLQMNVNGISNDLLNTLFFSG